MKKIITISIGNNIGVEGAIKIGEILKVNNTLTGLYLGGAKERKTNK